MHVSVPTLAIRYCGMLKFAMKPYVYHDVWYGKYHAYMAHTCVPDACGIIFIAIHAHIISSIISYVHSICII